MLIVTFILIHQRGKGYKLQKYIKNKLFSVIIPMTVEIKMNYHVQ